MLHLQVGPDHNLRYSLTLPKDASFLIFSGSLFHIFGPSAMRLLLPYFSVLRFLTSKSKGRTLELVLNVKIVFMKLGLSSLTVEKKEKMLHYAFYISPPLPTQRDTSVP